LTIWTPQIAPSIELSEMMQRSKSNSANIAVSPRSVQLFALMITPAPPLFRTAEKSQRRIVLFVTTTPPARNIEMPLPYCPLPPERFLMSLTRFPEKLSGPVLDGADHSVGGDRGLIDFSNVGEAEIFDCVIERSGGFGLRLRACGGWIERNAIRDIAAGGIFTTDETGLVIDDNRVERCGDNGIQVWRSIRGDDGARVEATSQRDDRRGARILAAGLTPIARGRGRREGSTCERHRSA
jgi:hypothetical protein